MIDVIAEVCEAEDSQRRCRSDKLGPHPDFDQPLPATNQYDEERAYSHHNKLEQSDQ
jgi:hypothetical protein